MSYGLKDLSASVELFLPCTSSTRMAKPCWI